MIFKRGDTVRCIDGRGLSTILEGDVLEVDRGGDLWITFKGWGQDMNFDAARFELIGVSKKPLVNVKFNGDEDSEVTINGMLTLEQIIAIFNAVA
jgi:hypothetical protein